MPLVRSIMLRYTQSCHLRSVGGDGSTGIGGVLFVEKGFLEEVAMPAELEGDHEGCE